MTTKLTPWTAEAYAAVTGAHYGTLEGQYGSIPTGLFTGLTGRIIEIYPNGTYLFDVQLDSADEHDEILVTDSDPRLFEVDMP